MDFKLHQEYIARALCVNRDTPIVACNGYCQLQERLQNTAEQDENLPAAAERYELHLFCVLPLELNWEPVVQEPILMHTKYREPVSSTFLSALFRPPPRTARYA